MRKIWTAGVISLALAAPAASAAPGQVFSLRITRHPGVVVRGVPIEISGEIQNVSGGPVTTAKYGVHRYGYPGRGFRVYARSTELTQGSRASCPDSIDGELEVTGPPKEVLPAGWHDEFTLPVCVEKPGTYRVQLVASSVGPYEYHQGLGGPWAQMEAWSGEEVSEAVTITIEEPTGVDRDAYEYFERQLFRYAYWGGPACYRRPDLFLRDFPTSTYAAYIIWEVSGAKGFCTNQPRDVIDRLKGGLLTVSPNSVPCTKPACPPGDISVGSWVPISGEDAAAWCAEWFEIVLKAHPQIHFRDELRFKAAYLQLAVGRTSEGAASMGALAKEARPDIAEKAKSLLTLLRNKGII